MNTEKVCRRCSETKPLVDFHKWARSKDGHADWCKLCRSAHAVVTKEQNAQRHARWYQENRQHVLARSSDWQQNNREQYRANMRRGGKAAYARDPLKFKNKQHLRRELYVNGMNAGTGPTPDEWADRLAEFNFHCAYCLKPLIDIEQEHMQPISRGGEHTITNLVPACRSCNASKGAKTLIEFAASL